MRDGEGRLDEVRGNSGDRRSAIPGAVICQNGGAELRYRRSGINELRTADAYERASRREPGQ